MSKTNKADRKKKQNVRFWLLTLLLAISHASVSEAYASAEAAAGNESFASPSLVNHCCRIEAERNDRYRASSENQIPCTCCSKYDEKLKTAVLPNSLRYHSNNGSLSMPKDTLSAQIQIVKRTIVRFPCDFTPIFLLIARFQI